MNARRSFFVLYLVAASVGALFAIELVCSRLNAARGIRLPFAIDEPAGAPAHPKAGLYRVLDPHLGYAHADTEAQVRAIAARYTWVNGFVVYGDHATELERPVILALGGSTTDGVSYGHSWPEELAKLLRERGMPGTVVNGATGGYSTNQELLKLVRDGLEFRPDIVISYSGVNDRGKYSQAPHPMVHPYQRQILEQLTRRAPSRLLPNTMAWLERVAASRSGPAITFTLGIESTLTPGEQYERNMVLMESVARSRGAAFFGVIQPHAYFRGERIAKLDDAKSEAHVAALRALYAQIIELPGSLAFVHDLTRILDDHEDVYLGDGVHVTQAGDAIIARSIALLISEELALRTSPHGRQ